MRLHSLRTWPAAALVAALAGCALPPQAPPPRPVALVVTSPLEAAERAFLSDAAARTFYEVEVSRLAARRAVDPRVRSYAEQMVNHHESGNRELLALMSAKGVVPPKGLSAKDATKLQRLAALPRSADFDKGYVRVVGVEDHAASVALFERMRRDARDRDVRAWIERALPGLRRHLAAARDLAGTIAA